MAFCLTMHDGFFEQAKPKRLPMLRGVLPPLLTHKKELKNLFYTTNFRLQQHGPGITLHRYLCQHQRGSVVGSREAFIQQHLLQTRR